MFVFYLPHSIDGYESASTIKCISNEEILAIEESARAVISKIRTYIAAKKTRAKPADFEYLYRLFFGEISAVQFAGDVNAVFKFPLGERALILEIAKIAKEKTDDGTHSVFSLLEQSNTDDNTSYYPSTTETIIGTLFSGPNLDKQMQNLGLPYVKSKYYIGYVLNKHISFSYCSHYMQSKC